MIHVAFCINDAYAQYVTVPIRGIGENNPEPVVVHVVTDGMSNANWHRIEQAAASFPQLSLVKHVVDDSCLRGLKDTWSIYTWYRVLLPDLLPKDVHRVLYLDADTLVTGDLAPLFELDMEGCAIGCAIDIENFKDDTRKRCNFADGDTYVCAGVMLMNLDYWREHNLAQRIIAWGFEHNDEIKFPDQDTINVLCKDAKAVLPVRYGLQNIFIGSEHFAEGVLAEQLGDAMEKPVIIHYAGCPPWYKEFDCMPLHHKWVEMNKRLKRPVMLKYQTKGLNKLKVIIYRLLHGKQ